MFLEVGLGHFGSRLIFAVFFNLSEKQLETLIYSSFGSLCVTYIKLLKYSL